MKEKIKENINKIYKIACLIVLVGVVFTFRTQNLNMSKEIVKSNSNPTKNLNIQVMNKVVNNFKAEEVALAQKHAEEEKAKKDAEAAEAAKVAASLAPVVPVSDLQAYAHDLVINVYGWTESDFTGLVNLWNRESGWRVNAGNSSSGAYGIPQALPGSKMSSEGADWATNGQTQIRWGLKYIAGKYGSPGNAWAFFCSHNWY